MTTFAPAELSGRRPDQPPVALFCDVQGPVKVDVEQPFVRRVGRRYQSGAAARLGVLFTAAEPVSAASFSIAFGSLEGRLVFDAGLWSVISPDAEGELVPIAEGDVLPGVEYAVSIAVDVGSGLHRDVIVEGRRVAPQVVDLIPGPQLPDESFIVDVLTGGNVETGMPEWVKQEIRQFDAEALLAIAREQGGRFEVTRTPEPVVESIPRPAPMAAVEGDAVFTFTVRSDGPLTVNRAWAVEA